MNAPIEPKHPRERNERFRNTVYGVAMALMIGWVLSIGQSVFIPIIASIILAYIIIALAELLNKIELGGRSAPASVRYLISILVIVAVVTAFVFLIISNINQLIALAPTYQAKLLSFIQEIARAIGEEFEVETEPTWQTIRRDVLGGISLQSLITSTITSISVLAGSVFVVLVYTGFALAERVTFTKKLAKLTDDPEDATRIADLITIINERIGNYLAAKTLVNLVLGLMSYIVMAFVGLDFAAFWGVLIALLNYIPYVGSFLGVAFPVAIAIVQFGDPAWIIGTAGALIVCQVLVGSFLEPNLMGRTLNLSPFVILVALTTWGTLWGIAGALLSVPITAILVIILSEFEGTRPFAVLLSRAGKIPPRRQRAGDTPVTDEHEHV
jgi:predicted PurR-regulated permease PerM